jgi:membrane protease YdiL (CAAX protease family)
VALLSPAALCLSAVALHVLLGGAVPRLYSPVPWYLLPAYFLLVLLFVGPMTEEIGWRWYALPMLQAERSALSASLILGSSWALWHLPLAWTGETSWPGLPFPLFALAIVALAILFTWAYNGTGGSLLIVLLFHAAINFTLTLVPIQPTSTMPLRTCLIGVGLLWAAAIVVVIAEGPALLTRKPPP